MSFSFDGTSSESVLVDPLAEILGFEAFVIKRSASLAWIRISRVLTPRGRRAASVLVLNPSRSVAHEGPDLAWRTMASDAVGVIASGGIRCAASPWNRRPPTRQTALVRRPISLRPDSRTEAHRGRA